MSAHFQHEFNFLRTWTSLQGQTSTFVLVGVGRFAEVHSPSSLSSASIVATHESPRNHLSTFTVYDIGTGREDWGGDRPSGKCFHMTMCSLPPAAFEAAGEPANEDSSEAQPEAEPASLESAPHLLMWHETQKNAGALWTHLCRRAMTRMLHASMHAQGMQR